MQRLSAILAAALLTCGLAVPAHAVCKPGDGIAGNISVLEGTIGKYPVSIALIVSAGGSIEGRYAYATSTSDIRLMGKLEDGGARVTLTEFNDRGVPSAIFDGTFPDTDPAIMSGNAKINCDVIKGQWRTIAGDKPQQGFKVVMTLFQKKPDFDHFYEPAGVKDDEVINRAAHAFRKAVVDEDRAEVARHIAYPFGVYLNKEQVTLADEAAFLARYDDIFLPRTRADVASAVPRLMFSRDAGVMLVRGGYVWLNRLGKVTTIYVH